MLRDTDNNPLPQVARGHQIIEQTIYVRRRRPVESILRNAYVRAEIRV